MLHWRVDLRVRVQTRQVLSREMNTITQVLLHGCVMMVSNGMGWQFLHLRRPLLARLVQPAHQQRLQLLRPALRARVRQPRLLRVPQALQARLLRRLQHLLRRLQRVQVHQHRLQPVPVPVHQPVPVRVQPYNICLHI